MPQYLLAIDMWLNPDFQLKLCSFMTVVSACHPFPVFSFVLYRWGEILSCGFSMWITTDLLILNSLGFSYLWACMCVCVLQNCIRCPVFVRKSSWWETSPICKDFLKIVQWTHLLLLDSSLPLLKSWNFHMADPPCILGSTFSPLCYFIILMSFKSLYISLKMNRLNNIRHTQVFHCLSRNPMMHLKWYDTAKQVRVVLWVFLTPNGWLCTVMITKRSPFYIYLYRVEPIGRLKWKRGFC